MDIEVEKIDKGVTEVSDTPTVSEETLVGNSSGIAGLERDQILKAQKKISYNPNQNGYRGTMTGLETYLNASKAALSAQKTSSTKAAQEPDSSIPCGKIIKLPLTSLKSDSK